MDDGDRARHAWHETQRFYKQTGYQLAWSSGTRWRRSSLDDLIDAVRAADQDGLEPADYHVDALDAARRGAIDAVHLVGLDVRATYTYLRYAADLSLGTIDPEDLNPEWHAAPRTVYLRDALQTGLGENNVAQSLARLAPKSAAVSRAETPARARPTETRRRRHRTDRDEHGALALAA